MVAALFDSNILIDHMRGFPQAKAEVDRYQDRAISIVTWIEIMSGLAEHGRPIAAGEPANLVLVDPTATVIVDRDAYHSLSRNTPWHGASLTGAVHTTILRGTVSARGGEPTAC